VDGNWTVLDLPTVGPNSDTVNTRSILKLLAGLFPNTVTNYDRQPVNAYLIDPFNTMGEGASDKSVSTIGHSVFEIRIGQILNAILYLGIHAPTLTGSFDKPNINRIGAEVNLNATVNTQKDIIKCNRAWFGVLITASLIIFVFAVLGAILRILTFAPDVLGSICAVFLNNRIAGAPGSSTWSSDKWGRRLKDTKLYMGDVEPSAEIGSIALVTLAEDVTVGRIKKGRYYS
jgi:hypothetical protein